MIKTRTMGWVLAQARAEAQLNVNDALFKGMRANAIRILNRIQDDLWESSNWSILKGNYDKTLATNQTAYDFPAGVGPMQIFRVDAKWGDRWYPVQRGITQQLKSGMDPERDQRLDPPSHWDILSLTQFEVWPEPATNGGIVRFSGLAEPAEMDSDNDTTTLDGRLLALYLAAELTKDTNLAKLKLAQADARKMRQTGALAGAGRRAYILGGEIDEATSMRQQPPLVAVDRG